jgi:WD40 repeat protein
VAFGDEGIFASVMETGWRLLDQDGGVKVIGKQKSLRRAGRLGAGVWALTYFGPSLFLVDGEKHAIIGDFYEGSSSPSSDLAVFAADDGGIWIFDGENLDKVGEHLDVIAVDVGDGSHPLVVAERYRVCIDEECFDLEDDMVVDVALNGELLAVGTLAGDVLVVDDESLETLAVLRGHTSRVSSVEFGPGWLVSASWDFSLRFWDLSILETDAETLVAEREEAWGMGLEEALQSR